MAFAQSFITGSTPARVFTGSAGVVAGKLLTPAVAQILGETLRIVGSTTLSTLTSGANAGTAGSGTISSSVAKPTAAANWTTNDLKRKYFMPISGGGAPAAGALPVARPILSNTTTTLALKYPIAGLDSTTVFQIVDLATLVDRISSTDLAAIRAAGVYGAIEIALLDFSTANALDSLVDLQDCADVKVSACNIGQNTAAPAVNILRCRKVTVEHCVQTSSGDIFIGDGCQNVRLRGNINYGGGVAQVEDFMKCDVEAHEAESAPSRALALIRGGIANYEANCNNCGATPVYLERISHGSPAGTLLTGSGNTGYGIEFSSAGDFGLTGCTITGTSGDVLFDGAHACTWALHFGSTYGRVTNAALTLTAQTAPTKTIIYDNLLFDGSIDESSRELDYGIRNPAQLTGITATGSTSSDALQLPAGEFYRIDGGADGTGVKSHVASALAGPICAYYNNTATTKKLYGGAGGTYNGAASYAMAAGELAVFRCVDFATDAWVKE